MIEVTKIQMLIKYFMNALSVSVWELEVSICDWEGLSVFHNCTKTRSSNIMKFSSTNNEHFENIYSYDWNIILKHENNKISLIVWLGTSTKSFHWFGLKIR